MDSVKLLLKNHHDQRARLTMWNRWCQGRNRSLKGLVAVVLVLTLVLFSYLYLFNSDIGKRPLDGEKETSMRDIPKPISKTDLVIETSLTSVLGEKGHVSVVNQSSGKFFSQVPTAFNLSKSTNSKLIETTTRIREFHSSHKKLSSCLSSTTSYVLAESYWEQQTSGCRNLQSLQCWAGRYGFSVVEPFFERSFLRIPLVSMKPSSQKFSDVFNIKDWNSQSSKMGSSKLVPWNVFLQQAPRNVITVYFKYSNSNTQDKKHVKQAASRARYLQGCPNMQSWPKKHQMYMLSEFKFTVVRKVCINFEFSDQFSLDDFHEAIFGEYKCEDVTVFFQQWRNFGSKRIMVEEDRCKNSDINERMQGSKQVVQEAETYAHMYLSSSEGYNNTTGHKPSYIAIIARLEKVQLSYKNRKDIVPFCFGKILSYHSKVVKVNSINKTFLAIDVGKFGSIGLRGKEGGSNLYVEFRSFFQELYGSELSIQAWERTFEDISQTTDPGYVALLQKVIVSKADCVIFAGGGSFQRHALKLYQLNHQKQNWCIHVVKECTLDWKF